MADRILNRVPVDKLEEIRDLLTERRHGNPARSPAHNARLLVDELIAVAPPPRRVPDRPSDAAIARAFWEVTGEYRPNVPSSVIAHGVITRAQSIDAAAAAPPAEAPAERGDWVLVPREKAAPRVTGGREWLEKLGDATETFTRQLSDWGKAYPRDIFSEPTDEELAWLQENRRGLVDRLSANMARHVLHCITLDFAAVKEAVAALQAANGGEG